MMSTSNEGHDSRPEVNDDDKSKKPSPETTKGEKLLPEQDDKSVSSNERRRELLGDPTSPAARRQPDEAISSSKRPPSSPPTPAQQGTSVTVSKQGQQLFRSRGKGKARLPEKLMEYLNAEVAPEALWWLPNEESFALDSKRVQKEVLDVYFRGTKLPSFIRSLNRWGFRRLFIPSLPKTAVCFHQRLFKRSEPHLVRQMELSSYTPQASSQNDSDSVESVAKSVQMQEATRPKNEPSQPESATGSGAPPSGQQDARASNMLAGISALLSQQQNVRSRDASLGQNFNPAPANLPQQQGLDPPGTSLQGQQGHPELLNLLQQIVSEGTQSNPTGARGLGALGLQQAPTAPASAAEPQGDLLSALQKLVAQGGSQGNVSTLASMLGVQQPPAAPTQPDTNQALLSMLQQLGQVPQGGQGNESSLARLLGLQEAPSAAPNQQEPQGAVQDLLQQLVSQGRQPNLNETLAASLLGGQQVTAPQQPAHQGTLQALLQQLGSPRPSAGLNYNVANRVMAGGAPTAGAHPQQGTSLSGSDTQLQSLLQLLVSPAGQGNQSTLADIIGAHRSPRVRAVPDPPQGSEDALQTLLRQLAPQENQHNSSILGGATSSNLFSSQPQQTQQQSELLLSLLARPPSSQRASPPLRGVVPQPPHQAGSSEQSSQQAMLLNLALGLTSNQARTPALSQQPMAQSQLQPSGQQAGQQGNSQGSFPWNMLALQAQAPATSDGNEDGKNEN